MRIVETDLMDILFAIRELKDDRVVNEKVIFFLHPFFTLIYWVDAKVSADFFSFLCFKFLLKQNTINQQRIYHCYL